MMSKQAMLIAARNTSGYPEPFRSRVQPREKRALGDAFGLDTIGVNLTTLGPGAESSMRHWHEKEDELVYVLEGELVLRHDGGEETLGAGMVVGFKAGVANAHQFVNRATKPAVYLEISNRVGSAERVEYPDVDLALLMDEQGRSEFVHKDGTPY